MFRGSCETRMDEKSRLKIPAPFRRVIDERFPGGEFFITSTTGNHARIYPMAIWKGIEQILSGIPSENESKKRFLNHVNYYGLEQQMDAQGRLVIHAPLRTKAELQGDVMVIAQGNFLEVWPRDRFVIDQIENNPYTDFDSKALEAFGI